MDIKLTLKSNNKSIEITKDTYYKLVSIEGIERSELELNLVDNAHYDGSFLVSKRTRNRPISITADYKGLNKEIERKKLISFLNPKNKGVLIVNYAETEKAIEYEIEDFNCPLTNIHDDLTFTVDLICTNPYWSDITKNKVEIALWKGQFHFPLIIPKNEGIIMGLKQPSLIVNIENKGDVETGMIIEFRAKGTLSNPSLFNVNTRESIKINKSMVAGEKIIVNTNYGEKRIENILNGVTTNILNLIDLGGGDTFLQLGVGDNLLRYDADTNPSNLEINIYFSPKYLGV